MVHSPTIVLGFRPKEMHVIKAGLQFARAISMSASTRLKEAAPQKRKSKHEWLAKNVTLVVENDRNQKAHCSLCTLQYVVKNEGKSSWSSFLHHMRIEPKVENEQHLKLKLACQGNKPIAMDYGR